MNSSAGGYLSFLDLMCCSFGSALLLLLLVAAANPDPPKNSQRNPVLVVRCFHKGGPKPEIRVECRRPGRQDWERVDRIAIANPTNPEAFEFTAPAEKDGGSESFVVFYDPRDGLWTFRAHLVGFPKDQAAGPVELGFEVEGEGVELTETKQKQELIWPGDYTAPVEVFVSRRQVEEKLRNRRFVYVLRLTGPPRQAETPWFGGAVLRSDSSQPCNCDVDRINHS